MLQAEGLFTSPKPNEIIINYLSKFKDDPKLAAKILVDLKNADISAGSIEKIAEKIFNPKSRMRASSANCVRSSGGMKYSG